MALLVNKEELDLQFKPSTTPALKALLENPNILAQSKPISLSVSSMSFKAAEMAEEEKRVQEQQESGLTADTDDTNAIPLLDRQIVHLIPHFLRLNTLTKLTIVDTNLQYFKQKGCLTFSTLCHLEELKLSKTELNSLPMSIGCLKDLRILDVSNNKLTTLPDTLRHCTKLESLDVSNNFGFRALPACVLDMPLLESIQSKSSMLSTSAGGTTVTSVTRVPAQGQTKDNAGLFQPSTLQHFAIQALLSSQTIVQLESLPPIVMRQLELYLEGQSCTICYHCNKLLLPSDNKCCLTVLAREIAGSNVSITGWVCEGECKSVTKASWEERQTKIAQRIDAEYQEMIRKANEEFGMDEYYRERVEHFRRIYKAQERRRFRPQAQCCVVS